MKPIQDVHMAEPGLLVVDAAAADEETALAFHRAVAHRWATAAADEKTAIAFERAVAEPWTATTTPPAATVSGERAPRVPRQSGVWLRFYLDLREELGTGR
ncbi:DUF6207 family protein [Streptomyces sp. NPDC005263]|uniref:DUF6207 family protein n=1 Tax=Streptomyces sp. NPDC005263 TaxID=3364711 RepID=UPI0036B89762